MYEPSSPEIASFFYVMLFILTPYRIIINPKTDRFLIEKNYLRFHKRYLIKYAIIDKDIDTKISRRVVNKYKAVRRL